jgi:hypothetical protein
VAAGTDVIAFEPAEQHSPGWCVTSNSMGWPTASRCAAKRLEPSRA